MSKVAAFAANIYVMHVEKRLFDTPATSPETLRELAERSFAAAEVFAALENEREDDYHRGEMERRYAFAVAEQENANKIADLAKPAEVTEGGYPENLTAKQRAAMNGWNPDHAEPDSLASYRPTATPADGEALESSEADGPNYEDGPEFDGYSARTGDVDG